MPEGAQGHVWQAWFLDWSPCHVGTLPVLQRRQRGQGRCQPPSPLRLWPLRRCGGGGVASLASSSPGTAIPATESNPICTGTVNGGRGGRNRRHVGGDSSTTEFAERSGLGDLWFSAHASAHCQLSVLGAVLLCRCRVAVAVPESRFHVFRDTCD